MRIYCRRRVRSGRQIEYSVVGQPKPSEREIMIGERIVKLEKFFGVDKPCGMNQIEWLERLQEMIVEWEGENRREFPI